MDPFEAEVKYTSPAPPTHASRLRASAAASGTTLRRRVGGVTSTRRPRGRRDGNVTPARPYREGKGDTNATRARSPRGPRSQAEA
eukprot:223091-Prorocentrum_minimum.AAC.1